jgi:hypothetical protein
MASNEWADSAFARSHEAGEDDAAWRGGHGALMIAL